MPKAGQDFSLLSLENLCHGAAGHLWQDALERLLEDIDDVNSDPKAKRKLELHVEVKPLSSREAADMKVTVKSKLAGHIGVTGSFTIAREAGKLKAYQGEARQMGIGNQTAGNPDPTEN